MTRLSEDDFQRVSEAVAKAERDSDGEIVTIVAHRSDAYHDVALHYAVLAMLLVPAIWAVVPQSWIDWWSAFLFGWNAELTRPLVMLILFGKLIAAFLVVRLALNYRPLRLALTPGGTKSRRVRRRALELFRSGCELRTRGRTGVLIYLSLEERRAEIIADRAIVEKTEPDVWGDAMAALVDEVKHKRPGAGMVLAVEKVGAVLATILPPKPYNPDELPNRLIVL